MKMIRVSQVEFDVEEDPFEDDTILQFEIRYSTGPAGSQTYSIVALRADGRWWTTSSQSRARLRWDELVEFVTKGTTVLHVWQVTERVRLV